MKNNITAILSVLVDCITIEEVLEKIKRSLSGKPRILPVVSINPEIVMVAGEHPVFKTIVNNAYLRLSDGIGIILAARVLGLPKLTRITGSSLMKKLTAAACDWNVPIGLIGGRPQVAIRTGDCLSKANPSLQWWAESGPEIRSTKYEVRSRKNIYELLDANSGKSYDFNDLIARINQTQTHILFCAFGAPKQEYFINHLKQYQSKLKRPLIAVSVGGAFDECAGMVSPAPAWIDRVGLKWLWRLIHEPWRWRRQIRLLKFISLIFLDKLRK